MAAVVSWVLSSWATARVVCVWCAYVCVCVVCESDTLGQRLVVKAAGVDIDRQGAGSTDGVGGRKADKLEEQTRRAAGATGRAGGAQEDATPRELAGRGAAYTGPPGWTRSVQVSAEAGRHIIWRKEQVRPVRVRAGALLCCNFKCPASPAEAWHCSARLFRAWLQHWCPMCRGRQITAGVS